MTPNSKQRPDPKRDLHKEFLGPRVQNFHPFRSTASHFQDIAHVINDFAIDFHVIIPKCHEIFKTWSIAKASINLYSPMVASALMKFDCHWLKTVRGLLF